MAWIHSCSTSEASPYSAARKSIECRRAWSARSGRPSRTAFFANFSQSSGDFSRATRSSISLSSMPLLRRVPYFQIALQEFIWVFQPPFRSRNDIRLEKMLKTDHKRFEALAKPIVVAQYLEPLLEI